MPHIYHQFKTKSTLVAHHEPQRPLNAMHPETMNKQYFHFLKKKYTWQVKKLQNLSMVGVRINAN